MTYPVLLSSVVVDSSNSAIRVKEGATTSTLTIASGTYFLRGDGSSDDLCKAIKTCLETHAGANTYTVSVAFDVDEDNVSAEVTISRATGSDTFQIQWASASTTFDCTLLGFASANTADDANDKVGTLTASCAWVCSAGGALREIEPEREHPGAWSVTALDGTTYAGSIGFARRLRRVGLQYIHGARAVERLNSSDQAASIERFLARVSEEGSAMELHEPAISSGTILAALSSSTRERTTWCLDEGSAQAIKPMRMSPAVALYSLDLRLVEEERT